MQVVYRVVTHPLSSEGGGGGLRVEGCRRFIELSPTPLLREGGGKEVILPLFW